MKSLRTIQESFYKNTKSGVNDHLQNVADKIKQYSDAETVIIEGNHIEVSGHKGGTLYIDNYPDPEFGCKVVVLGSVDRFRTYDCRLTSLSELEFSNGVPDMIWISKTDMETIDLDIKCPLTHLMIEYCKNLKHINLSECNKFNIKTLDVEHNPNLKSIDISNLKSIGKLDLQNCPELKDLNLNTEIKSEIFINNCESLTSLGSIKKIGFGNPAKKVDLDDERQRRTVIELRGEVSQDFDVDNIGKNYKISPKCVLYFNKSYREI